MDSTEGWSITVLKVYSLSEMPSTSHPLALPWLPSALKLEPARGLKVLEPPRFSPGCPLVTPGTRHTSWAKLRPFNGSSATAPTPMTSPSSALSARTSGAVACTVMLSVALPTSSLKSTRFLSSTLSTPSDDWARLNPALSAVTRYVPIGRNGTLKFPTSSVGEVLMVPLLRSVRVIVAPTIPRSVGSTTLPRIVPVTWAETTEQAKIKSRLAQMTNFVFIETTSSRGQYWTESGLDRPHTPLNRSEERRVGKECRSRWS